MPRLTQQTPKYRKHKASGQAVVTIGGKTPKAEVALSSEIVCSVGSKERN